MKKVIYLFVGLIALLFVTSCESEEPVVVEPVAQLGEVTFDVENFITDLQAKDGKLYESIVCNDTETPDFVYVKINGTGYELKIITLQTNDGKMQTEVLKLTPGDYTIEEFAVYSGTPNNNDDSDDTVLFASPEHASDYVTNWGMIGVGQGSTAFTVEAFKKDPVAVDVLCYVPSSYVDFGFTWFQFDKFKSKKIYFFGDVCTKFWEEWRDESGSPYANSITGYDFVASFKVDVYLGDVDGSPNVTGVYDAANPPLNVDGTAQPLCIEYVDNVNSVNENYTFVISLMMPTGVYEEIHAGTFTDLNWSADPVVIKPDGTTDNFGGIDGVFDFVVGNCSYDGNDANEELPAYTPIPTSGQFKYVNAVDDGYVGVQFRNLVGLQNDLTIANTSSTYPTQPMWCAAKWDIIYSQWYNANFYSSLDPADLAQLDPKYDNIPWNALNWLANNKGAYTPAQIQAAIWKLTDNYGSGNALSVDAVLNSSYVPSVGDWAIVIVDAIESGNMRDVQLMIVRVDP